MIKGEMKGVKNLLKAFQKLTNGTQKAAQDALAESTLAVHAYAVRSITEQGSSDGTVIRYNPKREVRVSKPGQPPNADTGRLHQSIGFEIDKLKGIGRVGTNLLYGAYLEFGTKDVAARPWLRPALMSQKFLIEKLFGQKLNVAVKETAK